MKKIKVLFVCMGNICRSPTAEGVFTHLIEQKNLRDFFEIDSAGTHAYHIDEAPDLRSQKAARDRGIELSHLRARQVTYGDFEDFDYLLVMDDANYEMLINKCPQPYQNKIQYLLDYATKLNFREVPDPYYGGQFGFEKVLDMVEDAAVGFLAALQKSGEIASN
jgi:protein-tyrosine phosphatase